MIRKLFKSVAPQKKVIQYEIGKPAHGGFYAGYIVGIQSHLIIADKNDPRCNFDASYDDVGKMVGKMDWELPTIYELELLYENFKLFNQANYEQRIDRKDYWSFSKFSNDMVWSMDFKKGERDSKLPNEVCSVRLIKVVHG